MFIYTYIHAHSKLNFIYLILVPHGCNGHDACMVNSALQFSENSKIRLSYCYCYAKL